ncbi:MAG TPA: septation protein A [Thermohalobaculum sp.]|nr:septation protein A [Thermohalobaculum sp.]
MEKRPENPVLKFVLEIGPLLIFFGSFRYARDLLENPAVYGLLEPLVGAKALAGESGPLFVATAVFMVAIAVSLAVSWKTTGHLPRMAVVTAVVVAVFGGLTLWLQDETFIKMKPTIVYGIFATILGFGLLRQRSYLKYLMGTAMPLDDAGWMIFTRRWVLFFLFMALVNEGVWRSQTTETWVTFKTFATLPMTLLFMMLQFPLLKRHMVEEG